MAAKEKMESRELGLVLAEILMGAKDLHYGYWDEALQLSMANARLAQQRYTDKLIADLPPIGGSSAVVRVLDVGCGGGHMMTQMLDRGYFVDGVSPSKGLSRRVRQRLAHYPQDKSRLFECKFQDFPQDYCQNQYDAVLFSESFQYIKLRPLFDKLQVLLKPGGIVIICDFFKTPADGDGGPGDQSIKGGHLLKDFYTILEEQPFAILEDEDITTYMSPNLQLVNDLLMTKIKPAGLVLGQYIRGRYPKTVAFYKLIRPFFRKTEKKIHFKYFSGYRSKEVFERYKTYRHIILAHKPQDKV